MLKKLQKKFLAIAMCALAAILFVQLFAVNAINIYQRDTDVRSILKIIADNNGSIPSSKLEDSYSDFFFSPFGKFTINIETPYSTRYFVVQMDNNVVTRISTENIAAVTDQMAFEYATTVFENKPGYGYIDEYRYLFVRDGNKSMIVFLDFSKEIEQTYNLARISLIVALVCMLLVFFPIYLLSKRALAPVKKSIDKQKQFITDAGHELKTPIAIISADAEVLEICDGENEWLTSIKNQTRRLNSLVKNLVDLSKLDETRNGIAMAEFNISDAVIDTASNFSTSAKAGNIDFSINVCSDIKYNGCESEIRQLISILCDNAIKYTNDGGNIKLSLYKSNRNIIIEMYNTCEHIDPSSTAKLFDRFYRADSSRARETGGYGIGLSIAKAIVERHKGKIKAFSSNSESLNFKIVL